MTDCLSSPPLRWLSLSAAAALQVSVFHYAVSSPACGRCRLLLGARLSRMLGCFPVAQGMSNCVMYLFISAFHVLRHCATSIQCVPATASSVRSTSPSGLNLLACVCDSLSLRLVLFPPPKSHVFPSHHCTHLWSPSCHVSPQLPYSAEHVRGPSLLPHL